MTIVVVASACTSDEVSKPTVSTNGSVEVSHMASPRASTIPSPTRPPDGTTTAALAVQSSAVLLTSTEDGLFFADVDGTVGKQIEVGAATLRSLVAVNQAGRFLILMDGISLTWVNVDSGAVVDIAQFSGLSPIGYGACGSRRLTQRARRQLNAAGCLPRAPTRRLPNGCCQDRSIQSLEARIGSLRGIAAISGSSPTPVANRRSLRMVDRSWVPSPG